MLIPFAFVFLISRKTLKAHFEVKSYGPLVPQKGPLHFELMGLLTHNLFS